MAVRFKTLAPALVFCSMALPAMADESIDSHNSYISLSAGKSKSADSCTMLFTSDATCSEKGTVYRLGYGYHFTPAWGMEISYGDFGRAEEDGILALPPLGVPGGGPVPYTRTYEAVGWEIAATGTWHFGKSFSLIGKLGVLRANVGQEIVLTTPANGIWHAVDHHSNNSISTGVGAQYDFNESFALRVLYNRFGKLGDLSDLYGGSATKISVSATHASLILKF